MDNNKLNFSVLVGSIFTTSVFFVIGFIYVQAATDVSTSTQTITLDDSDGDGLLDNEDPHPDIPEIYIVEDKNLNGIVDLIEPGNLYELQQGDITLDISNSAGHAESPATDEINNNFNLEDLYYGEENDD